MGRTMDLELYRKRAIFETLPRKHFNKIFCIGYNKTGTSSLEVVLRALGYELPDQGQQELRLTQQLYDGNFRPLVEFCSKYDAFQDSPFSKGVVFAQADCLFPNSKFVLSVRDPDKWYESLVRYHLAGILKQQGITDVSQVNEETYKDKTVYLYENYSYANVKRIISRVVDGKLVHDWSRVYDKAHYIEMYQRRNEQIMNYFQDRPWDLLVIDVEKEADISRILAFLDLPEKLNFEMPHMNRSQ